MQLINKVKIYFLILLKIVARNWKIILAISGFFVLLITLQLKFNIVSVGSENLSQGMIGTYQQHDLPQEVTRLISKGLVKIDGSGKPKGDLASWQVNHNATVFTFKLNDNLKWTDNTTLKSTDLEFNIPNVEIEYLDENQIKFKLKESFSPFPSLLTKPVLKKGTTIGVGPYKVLRQEKSRIFITKLQLTAENQDLPNLTIRFYPSEKIAQTGLALGEIQSLIGVSRIINLGAGGLKVYQKTDFTKIVTILYQTKDQVLSNRSLRQALSFAAPTIQNEEEANNPLPKTSWAFNKEVKNYIDNQNEAKNALDRAKSTSSAQILKAEIILTTTPNLEVVGKKVISAWQQLGMNSKLRVESGIPQNFQALLITQTIPTDPDQYFLWHSTQDKTNLTKYSSARIDKDLEDGRKSLAEEERKAKYLDFQRVLLEDSPATFLYFPKTNVVYLQKVEKLLNKVLPLQL